jgi:hypothetical protein
MRENGIEIDTRTGRPEFWNWWNNETKKAYLRGKAKRAGVDVDALEEIIHDVIKSLGPDLRHLRYDIAAEIQKAIRELKASQARAKAYKPYVEKQTCSGRCEGCKPKCWET